MSLQQELTVRTQENERQSHDFKSRQVGVVTDLQYVASVSLLFPVFSFLSGGIRGQCTKRSE